MRPIIEKYIQAIQSRYPSTRDIADLESRLNFLISDHSITLPTRVFTQVQSCIQAIYKVSHTNEFLERIRPTLSAGELEILNNGPKKQRSILMAYDFHWSQDRLTLIEVNTTASSYLLADSIYHTFQNTEFHSARTKLKESFETEKLLFDGSAPQRIAIVDESPQLQKQYPEFLMYRDLFHEWGWRADIHDVSDFDDQQYDFIYNRHTDFYFSRTPKLRKIFIDQKSCVSPNPREYLLLADKNRLIDFADLKIHSALLNVEPVLLENTERLWANRKKLFFKPKRMFGSKGAYRGSSISRKVFDRIVSERSYIAQEYSPPGLFNDFKFDLRFFVYQDQIQLACARLYRGQVTGFNTIGGGLAPLKFTRD